MEDQANLPGTVDGHPNWRRKLPMKLEDLPQCGIFQCVAGVIAAERPRVP
jgi:4-alpha-glucanotransferase